MSDEAVKKMNPDVKAKWVAALRSGEFRQIEGFLRDEEGYCCLGVLCEVANREKAISSPYKGVAPSGEKVFYYNGSDLTTPYEVDMWAGMSSPKWRVKYKGHIVSLTDLNDDYRLSFSEIADLIEEQL